MSERHEVTPEKKKESEAYKEILEYLNATLNELSSQ